METELANPCSCCCIEALIAVAVLWFPFLCLFNLYLCVVLKVPSNYDDVSASLAGNKGIGFEICKQLASAGVHTVLTARNSKYKTIFNIQNMRMRIVKYAWNLPTAAVL